jgi:hypothetical protein
MSAPCARFGADAHQARVIARPSRDCPRQAMAALVACLRIRVALRAALAVFACGCVVSRTAASLYDHFVRSSNALPSLPCTVARLDLDIDGDGTPEMFLSQSHTSGTSGAQEWIVSSRAGDKSWVLVGLVGFSADLFKVSVDPDGKVIQTFHGNRGGPGTILTYDLDGSGIYKKSEVEDAAVDGAQWMELREWRAKHHVPLYMLAWCYVGWAAGLDPSSVFADLIPGGPCGAIPASDSPARPRLLPGWAERPSRSRVGSRSLAYKRVPWPLPIA